MFTGIVEATGEVTALDLRGGDVRLRIRANSLDLSKIQLGDSIATNGVCLTVASLLEDGYESDVSSETLSVTSVSSWHIGTKVNLERALTIDTRLGGHLVLGHVDGIGEVVHLNPDARSWCLRICAPNELAKYIAQKGSITVDGTSLTVNKVEGAEFELNIVPHTLEHTGIGSYQAGSLVNLEVDVIARYVERLLLGDSAANT
ncbi:MAG: riboflavin synthase [Porticoccus sp.]|jgi:riboflavin synthase|uniref:riboflavin synthase n=1 Tax=Porticoccus sp. Uisw_050_02 TaxID=3230978 RepID=UPI001E195FE5|nr:riboflavin synthase [Porticoccus sp.]MDO7653839.1 riboflavin synthase [Porticoccus sp.]|tara:strand:+ start:4840 stop:5448 length:609 start_codon:yes stop_codon:yes gene_type:complete